MQQFQAQVERMGFTLVACSFVRSRAVALAVVDDRQNLVRVFSGASEQAALAKGERWARKWQQNAWHRNEDLRSRKPARTRPLAEANVANIRLKAAR